MIKVLLCVDISLRVMFFIRKLDNVFFSGLEINIRVSFGLQISGNDICNGFLSVLFLIKKT